MPTALVARAFERAVVLLRRHGAAAGMRRKANCYDNAKMESLWATLKGELIQDHVFATRAEAKSAIFRYIEGFYNWRRLHRPSVFNPLGTLKPN